MNDEYFDEIKDKIEVLPDIDRKSIESLLVSMIHSSDKQNEITKNWISDLVETQYTTHMLKSKNPILSYPDQETSKGDGFVIGQVTAGDIIQYPFELTTENLRENVFITARAGHGKTTLIYYFVDSLIQNKINFIFPDWKNDYRNLASIYDDILVIRWNDLKFNPLTNVPQGMDTKLWWRVVMDILSHSQGLLMATPNHIVEAITQLNQDRKGNITFQSLQEFLKGQNDETRKEQEYSAIAENRIGALNQVLGSVLNVKHGFEIKDLFNKKVVIEMQPLDFSIASFLIQTLIMHEFYRRLHNNIRLNKKSTLSDDYFTTNFCMLIMDEAHLTQGSSQEDSLVSKEFTPPPLTTFFSQSRELLIGTLAATQFPHKVMGAFKDNAGTRIIGSITEGEHQIKMASSIGLDRDDHKIFGKLQKGNWICNVAGRAKPFVLSTPEVSKGDMIAEEELLPRSGPILEHMLLRMQELESLQLIENIETESKKLDVPELPMEAWLILDYVLEHPWKYQKLIADALNISGRKLDKAKKVLVSRGLVKIEKFAVKIHPRVHFVLTSKALELLKRMGRSNQRIGFWKFLNGTSYEHRYWQNHVRSLHVIMGYDCKVEHKIDDRRLDVYAEKGRKKVAIEIECSTKDVENKIKILLDGKVDSMFLLYTNETHLQFAISLLEKMKIEKPIGIEMVKDFSDKIKGIIKEDIIRDTEKSGNIEKDKSSTPEKDENRKQSGNMETD